MGLLWLAQCFLLADIVGAGAVTVLLLSVMASSYALLLFSCALLLARVVV